MSEKKFLDITQHLTLDLSGIYERLYVLYTSMYVQSLDDKLFTRVQYSIVAQCTTIHNCEYVQKDINMMFVIYHTRAT